MATHLSRLTIAKCEFPCRVVDRAEVFAERAGSHSRRAVGVGRAGLSQAPFLAHTRTELRTNAPRRRRADLAPTFAHVTTGAIPGITGVHKGPEAWKPPGCRGSPSPRSPPSSIACSTATSEGAWSCFVSHRSGPASAWSPPAKRRWFSAPPSSMPTGRNGREVAEAILSERRFPTPGARARNY